MEKKQVAFRIQEDLYRQLQMYALQRNTSVQELMEKSVHQILRGGAGLSIRLIKILKEAIENRKEEIKEHLLSAYQRSLRIDSVDDDSVIQVIINEFGEIFERESIKGILPNVITESKGYVLYEFNCRDVLDVYYKRVHFNGTDWDMPTKEMEEGFAEWLLLQGLVKEDKGYENNASDIVEEFYEQQVHTEGGGLGFHTYLKYIYQWSPKAFWIIKNRIREPYLALDDDELESFWTEILKRPEIHEMLEG